MNKLVPSILLFMLCVSPLAPVVAQEPDQRPGPVYVEALFIHADSEYSLIDWEKLIWKPIYAELMKSKHCTGWQLFSVEDITDDGLNYNYIVLHYYNSMDQLELNRREFARAFQAAHPDKNQEDILEKSADLREIVYTEVFALRHRVFPEKTRSKGPFFYLHMKRVPLRNLNKYLEFETAQSDALVETIQDQNAFENRSVWEVVSTDLSSWDYNHVVVESWADEKAMRDYQRPSGKDVVLNEKRKRNKSWKDLRREVWVLEDELFIVN